MTRETLHHLLHEQDLHRFRLRACLVRDDEGAGHHKRLPSLPLKPFRQADRRSQQASVLCSVWSHVYDGASVTTCTSNRREQEG